MILCVNLKWHILMTSEFLAERQREIFKHLSQHLPTQVLHSIIVDYLKIEAKVVKHLESCGVGDRICDFWQRHRGNRFSRNSRGKENWAFSPVLNDAPEVLYKFADFDVCSDRECLATVQSGVELVEARLMQLAEWRSFAESTLGRPAGAATRNFSCLECSNSRVYTILKFCLNQADVKSLRFHAFRFCPAHSSALLELVNKSLNQNF
mgnify:CR=1 FL=1